jgi:hypothetical protein
VEAVTLAHGGLLALGPRSALLRRLAAHGPQGEGWRCTAHFSGRTALAAVARALNPRRRVVLVPAYLCNVVAMAFEREGWRVINYEVDERFAPSAEALWEKARAESASALLLAPLYGSDGGLREWVSATASARRRAVDLSLVLDLCQDAGWLRAVPSGLHDCAVVTSFNDKSFPGAMGAAVWSDLPLTEAPPLPVGLAARLAWWRLRVWLSGLRPRAGPAGEGFEFSRAVAFPYDFALRGASRWQIALGVLGLVSLPRWQARRLAAQLDGRVHAVEPSAGSSSPFVLVADDDPGRHRTKLPYAMVGDPTRSLRPDLRVRHNKGFADR